MAQSTTKLETSINREQIRAAISEFLKELGNPQAIAAFQQNGWKSHLERDLSLGSLERAELILRVEGAAGVHFPESTLADAITTGDLVEIAGARSGSPVIESASAPTTAKAGMAGSGTGISEQDHGKREPAADSQVGSDIATLTEVLQWRARFQPEREHILLYENAASDAPPRPITHTQLLEGAEAIAAALQRAGLEHGGTVALMLPTCAEFFSSFFGVLLAGGVPVPLYPPFRADRIEEYAERQTAILRNAEARFLLTFREAEGLARLLRNRVPTLRGVMCAAKAAEQGQSMLEKGANGRPRFFIPHHAQPHDLAFLQYTSGSTGSPKGVMLTHANLLANIRAIGEAGQMGPRDVAVSWLPLYHDMGLIGAWLVPLYFGMPVAILSPLAFLLRPSQWLRAIHAHRGTLSAAPNFAYELCVRKIPDKELEGLDLSSWRAALNGAEPVRKETAERFTERFKAYGFSHSALIPVYGLAEATLAVCSPVFGSGTRVDRVARASFEREGRANHAREEDSTALQFVSVGKPLAGVEIQIVDRQHDKPAAERQRESFSFAVRRQRMATIAILKQPPR